VRDRAFRLAAVIAFSVLPALSANSQTLSEGLAAYGRGDYVRAAQTLGPLALRGNARAQAFLGFMYQYGLGVPQAYDEAATWYNRAAEQGDPTAQYSLGLMYDKGQGVGQNEVIAHKWLNLAAAHAPARERESYIKLRNAVASKMTTLQLARAQALALEWRAKVLR
jgi:TPR repeat protein